MKINMCMNKKLSICLVLLSTTMFFTACAKYSSPSLLLKPPQKISKEQIKADIKGNTEINIKSDDAEVDYKKVVEEFFSPENVKFLSPDKIVSKKSVYNMDLDGDNIDEVFGFLETDEDFKIDFFILKKKNNRWDSKFIGEIDRASISFIDTAKVYNEDQISLIIGKLVSDYAGSEYTIYTVENESGVLNTINIGMWNKFEILSDFSHENNKGFVFGSWYRERADLYSVNVIGYDANRSKFVPKEDLYLDYFKDAIEYNNKILDKNDKAQLAWYYLIDAQIKAGESEDALKSIDKVIKIKKDGNPVLEVEDYKFELLRGKALNKLQRYDEAEDIILSLSHTLSEVVSNNKSVEYHDYINMETELDLADVYFQLGKTYLGKDKKIKAEEAFKKSHGIIKELSKIPFYKENPAAIIKKHLIYYPVMDELYKLQDYNY